MALIKNPTLQDFNVVTYVPWSNVRDVLGIRRYRKFQEWMRGQTCREQGVYPWDLEAFLKGLPVYD